MATNMMSTFAFLPVIYMIRQIDLKDETNLFYAKAAFAAVVGLLSLVYAYIYWSVGSRKGARADVKPVKVPAPANADGTPGTGTVSVPTWEYDQQETRKAAQQLLFGAAFTTFLVFQFSFNQVLLIQAVMLVRGAFSSPVVQIHLFGRPATDALKRPFVTASPFADMMKQFSGTAAPDAAAAAVADDAADTPAVEAASTSGSDAGSKKARSRKAR